LEHNITGRDGHVIRKALAYAIASIDSLPERRQEFSDRSDMLVLLLALVPHAMDRDALAKEVESHTGTLPNIAG
jgi:hypothetical protein